MENTDSKDDGVAAKEAKNEPVEGSVEEPSSSNNGADQTTNAVSGTVATNKEEWPKDENGKPLSKNAVRKKRRLEYRKELHRKKKQQKKDMQLAKAKAEGRDLEKERREVEERTRSGEGRRKREKVCSPLSACLYGEETHTRHVCVVVWSSLRLFVVTHQSNEKRRFAPMIDRIITIAIVTAGFFLLLFGFNSLTVVSFTLYAWQAWNKHLNKAPETAFKVRTKEGTVRALRPLHLRPTLYVSLSISLQKYIQSYLCFCSTFVLNRLYGSLRSSAGLSRLFL